MPEPILQIVILVAAWCAGMALADRLLNGDRWGQ